MTTTKDGHKHNELMVHCYCLDDVRKEMLEVLKEAQKIISVAREYFPKSIRNTDKFSLENTCARIGSAIAKAEGR